MVHEVRAQSVVVMVAARDALALAPHTAAVCWYGEFYIRGKNLKPLKQMTPKSLATLGKKKKPSLSSGKTLLRSRWSLLETHGKSARLGG